MDVPKDLTKEELSLLKFLSGKRRPTYVMEQDMPALHGLQKRGMVAINGNIAVLIHEFRIVEQDTSVREHLAMWSKAVRAKKLGDPSYGLNDAEPLALAVRKTLTDNGIDPSTVYPSAIEYSNWTSIDEAEGKMRVTLVFNYDKVEPGNA